MGYSKMITYSDVVELYQYEKQQSERVSVSRGRSKKQNRLPNISFDGTNGVQQGDLLRIRRQDHARSTAVAFRRLVSANLGESEKPLLLSLTYAENFTDVRQGFKDFKAFVRAARSWFGTSFRYIAVPEFQTRGALHFHVLVWDLASSEIATEERRTRVVAGLWGKGFADVKVTDGDHKISGYLAKYMSKAFVDHRIENQKAYVASRNIKRPIVEKNPLLLPLFWGGLGLSVDLSTAELQRDVEYDTKYYGRGRYRRFKLLDKVKI